MSEQQRETQRQPVPRVDTSELDTALAFLRFARSCVVKKCEGLPEEALRRPLVASGNSLLGLVVHLTVSERWWFGYHLDAGYPDQEWDFELRAPAGLAPETALQDYAHACASSDATVLALGDLEARTARPVDGQHLRLRWVLAHMTSETARHAGHADILRELLDGTTGR